MPPPYLRAIVRMRRREATAAALHMLELRPERVIFAHGRWFERDGTAALTSALRWLVRPTLPSPQEEVPIRQGRRVRVHAP
jgi:hypothetical protein